MTEELAFRVKGEGEPLVMLHGLFGSGDNLGGIIRLLSAEYKTIALDLRGHGRSPHLGTLSYPQMADDVMRFMDKQGIESAYVFGHSMGGKTAMQLAISHPNRVKKLIVGDIAPVAYTPHHTQILAGMQAVAKAAPTDRKEAETLLAEYESEPEVLSFLLTNWRRVSDNTWGWRLDLEAICRDYDNLIAGIEGGEYEGETLFLRGGRSDYIKAEHRDTILRLFPKASVKTVEGTSHWLHAEKPDLIARAIMKFLQL
ncbi:alpha/beta fold hydrolase [Kordiimonas pumila]|uniref:Alpha/beta fold hydrolase n=1 Tax=Kordiimonas pumila TaxID=2161677 RepID=A0ABV7D7I7_9PROT|nr:alpha/beta fold hydrolase [Kordiimonas pumila]